MPSLAKMRQMVRSCPTWVKIDASWPGAIEIHCASSDPTLRRASIGYDVVPRAFVEHGRKGLTRIILHLHGVWAPVRAFWSRWRAEVWVVGAPTISSRMSAALNAGWIGVRRASSVDITGAIRYLRRRGPIPRRLLVLDIFLIVVSATLIVSISRVLFVPDRLPTIRIPQAAAVFPLPPDGREPAGRMSAGYEVIAARNLFDPGRSEKMHSAGVVLDAALQPKPLLYGVILSDDRALGLAYLQDPVTRRIAGYRIGDPLAGGRIESIERDRVLIRRGAELVEVSMNRSHTPSPPDAVPVASEPTASAVPTRRIPKD